MTAENVKVVDVAISIFNAKVSISKQDLTTGEAVFNERRTNIASAKTEL